MTETDISIVARREAYRVVSWVLLGISLLLLILVGLALPLFGTPLMVNAFHGKEPALPRYVKYLVWESKPALCLLVTGFLGTLLIAKEILASPKARFWFNILTIIFLLVAGVCHYLALWVPMWNLTHTVQLP